MEDCLFCRIAAGQIRVERLAETDELFSFPDIQPMAPVHALVIPKKHIPTLNDLMPEDNPLIGQMFQVAKKLAVQSNIHEKGYRTVFNVNAGAGQSVYHIHLHVLGGRMFSWPPG